MLKPPLSFFSGKQNGLSFLGSHQKACFMHYPVAVFWLIYQLREKRQLALVRCFYLDTLEIFIDKHERYSLSPRTNQNEDYFLSLGWKRIVLMPLAYTLRKLLN